MTSGISPTISSANQVAPKKPKVKKAPGSSNATAPSTNLVASIRSTAAKGNHRSVTFTPRKDRRKHHQELLHSQRTIVLKSPPDFFFLFRLEEEEEHVLCWYTRYLRRTADLSTTLCRTDNLRRTCSKYYASTIYRTSHSPTASICCRTSLHYRGGTTCPSCHNTYPCDPSNNTCPANCCSSSCRNPSSSACPCDPKNDACSTNCQPSTCRCHRRAGSSVFATS